MDDAILSKLSTVELNETESVCLLLDDPDILEGIQEDDLSVFIHLYGCPSFNFDGFRKAMGRSWRCGSFSIQRFNDLFFKVFFDNQDTVDFVLSNGPWNFEDHLILVRPRRGGDLTSSQCLQKEFLWVLLTGLPRYCYTWEVGSKLSGIFDSVQIIELHEARHSGQRYFRLRLLINLLKPLQRVFRVTTPDGITHTGLLKYERLPLFCFSCGHVGHRFRECPTTLVENIKVSDFNFGSWKRGVDNLLSDQIFSRIVSADHSPVADASLRSPTPAEVFNSALIAPVLLEKPLSALRSEPLVDIPVTMHASPPLLTPQKRSSSDRVSTEFKESTELSHKKTKIYSAEVARQPRWSP